MAYDPDHDDLDRHDLDRHNRQSIRLPEYDYRLPGAYFVPTCTADRRCLFGTVENGRMRLNDSGRIVAEEWQRMESVRDRVVVDTFIVMPNHTHGVIVITDPPDDNSSDRSPPVSDDDTGDTHGEGASPMNPHYHDKNPDRTFGGVIAGSLSTIMRQLKSMVTKRIDRLRDTSGADMWQRNFYDRGTQSGRTGSDPAIHSPKPGPMASGSESALREVKGA